MVTRTETNAPNNTVRVELFLTNYWPLHLEKTLVQWYVGLVTRTETNAPNNTVRVELFLTNYWPLHLEKTLVQRHGDSNLRPCSYA